MLKTQFYKNLEKKIMVFVLDSIRVQFCIWFNWFQKSVCVLKSCSDNLRTESILRAVQLTLFLAFDEDGDGFLNLEQVYQAIHSLGKVWPMKDIREALPKDCKEVDFPGKYSSRPKNVNDSKVNDPKVDGPRLPSLALKLILFNWVFRLFGSDGSRFGIWF